jgi:erythromycin esterase
MKFYLLFSLVLLLFSFQCYSQVTVQLGKNNEIVYPVTPNETNDLVELFPIERLFNDRKVVGMGEATHGTREFFNMKAKMFKFLATYCGYRIFSIEATYGGTLKVNDYVLYGKGDVLSAMKGMEFWTWDTEEVKDLIEWMRTFNIGKPEKEKLKFYGFDCQSFKGPTNALMDYVKEFDKPNLDEFVKGLSILNDSSYLYFYTLKPGKSSQQRIVQIHGIISFIQKWFQENEKLYIAGSSMTKFELAKHNIDALKQAILLKECLNKKSYTYRDSCMAQNIRWIYELEHSAVFLWAHNDHISKNEKYYFNKDKTMGAYLNDIFGEAYYNICFVFNQGGFLALPKVAGKLQEFSVPESKINTLTNGLSLAGINNFYIDLTLTNNKLFQDSNLAYDIGAIFNPKNLYLFSKVIRAKQQFNGLIFIHTTTSVVPIIRKLSN